LKKLYAVIIGLLIALNCANVQACDACNKGKKKKKHKASWEYTIVQTQPKSPPANQLKPATPEVTPVSPIYIDSLDILKNPKAFLNKPVFIKAKFDKFSTLGLDYPPVNRTSTDYITFLVQRSDAPDHDVPLSEVKFFMKRTYAEKFIDLETGDIVHIHGKMFSNALSDVWIDVDKIDIKEKVKKSDK